MAIPADMPTETSKQRRGHGGARGMFLQVVTAVALSMTHFNMAASVAISGVLTEQMSPPSGTAANDSANDATENTADDIQLTMDQVSWINSVYNFGAMAGFLLSSYMNPRLGALRLTQINAPLVAGGLVMMGLGKSFAVILSGRILSGAGIGMCLGPTVTHMGEISCVKLRSALTTFLIIMGCSGITFAYFLGWVLGWRYTCLVIGTVPMIIQFIITIPLPRSARWLISKGYPEEEAERSLRFYMGSEHDVSADIAEIKKSLGAAHKHDASLPQVLATLRYRHHLLPLLIVICMYALFVFSGGLAATSFAPVIFKQVGGFKNPYLGSIMLGGVRTVTTIVTAIIVDRVARRTLLMINGGVGSLACLGTGLYFFYKEELADYGWLPLVSVLVIVCMMSLGISPLMTVMFSELLPNAIRAEASGINLAVFAIFNFTMVYTFPLLLETLGLGWIFSCYAGLHLVMVLFARFCMPETRGKTIEEIQKLFMRATVEDAIKPLEVVGKLDLPVPFPKGQQTV